VRALLGRPPEELIGRRWAEYSDPDDVPLWQVLLAQLAGDDDTYLCEMSRGNPSASSRTFSTSLITNRQKNSSPTRRYTTRLPAFRTEGCSLTV
jgi:hypothetical protein